MAKSRKNDKKNRIPEPQIPDNKIRFSFEYYDGSKYCLSEWEKKDIAASLKRLGEVNQKTYNDMKKQSAVHNFHPVDWAQTKERNGFRDKRVNNLDPYQFSLLGINNQKARVFGGLGSNIFYIVWFDFDHKIYPSFKKNT